MPPASSIERWALTDLAARCAQETARFLADQSSDPQFCFALFRRAIADRNERAWSLVWAQYRAQTIRWVERHPSFFQTGEEAPYFCGRAFERMWSALSSRPFAFHELAQVLRYLQMCVHSVIMDHVRAAEHATVSAQARLTENLRERDPSPEEQVLSKVEREALWHEVDARLNGEQERCVIYSSYVLGLKPRQIMAQHEDLFSSVQEIYRIKENVLARFSRDASLAQSLRPA